ncbi:MAG: hypothetical protein ABR535_10115 [Pyrinomonadaceae bacterium]
MTNQDRIEIFPSAENKFFLKVLPARAEFTRDAAGGVTGVIWRQGASEFTTKRSPISLHSTPASYSHEPRR